MAFGRKSGSQSKTQTPRSTTDTPPRRTANNPFGSNSENLWFLRLIYWLAFSVGVVIALFNIIPYVKSVEYPRILQPVTCSQRCSGGKHHDCPVGHWHHFLGIPSGC
jgi:hypothetical protein